MGSANAYLPHSEPAGRPFQLGRTPVLPPGPYKLPTAKFSRVFWLFFVRSRGSLFFVPSPTVDRRRRAGRVKDAGGTAERRERSEASWTRPSTGAC